MFVLTEIIDCIFLLFSKILSPVLSILRCTRLITNVAQDGVFLEIALHTLWTPQLHSDNVITLRIYISNISVHYFHNDEAIPTN
jgi:hypothetical protein